MREAALKVTAKMAATEAEDAVRQNTPAKSFTSDIHRLRLHWQWLHWSTSTVDRFPRLAKLSKSYLAISATSTPREWIFSLADDTVTRQRSSLHPSHVDVLVFLNANQKDGKVDVYKRAGRWQREKCYWPTHWIYCNTLDLLLFYRRRAKLSFWWVQFPVLITAATKRMLMLGTV